MQTNLSEPQNFDPADIDNSSKASEQGTALSSDNHNIVQETFDSEKSQDSVDHKGTKSAVSYVTILQ